MYRTGVCRGRGITELVGVGRDLKNHWLAVRDEQGPSGMVKGFSPERDGHAPKAALCTREIEPVVSTLSGNSAL
jgi:hypothetical protein